MKLNSVFPKVVDRGLWPKAQIESRAELKTLPGGACKNEAKSERLAAASLVGCETSAIERRLQSMGLRPTRQRIALGRLLFGKGHRHLTAEMLYAEATAAGVCVSLATTYNALNQFAEAGLLRKIGIETKTYFDTNVTEHSHFIVEHTHELVDMTAPCVVFHEQMNVPQDYEVSQIDIVVRLRRKAV